MKVSSLTQEEDSSQGRRRPPPKSVAQYPLIPPLQLSANNDINRGQIDQMRDILARARAMKGAA
jgi:hypothetical protein